MRSCLRSVTRAVALAVVVASCSKPCAACTAFAVESPEGWLLAKGFDWVTGEGWVVLNERGRSRSMLFPASPQDPAYPSGWIARFASVTLTTVGPGFPVSGMNEAGLAMEALVDFSASASTVPTPGRLTGPEFLQYALDRFGSIVELSAYVNERTPEISQLAVPLHFFACDQGGDCVVIEVRHGRPQLTRELPVRALANRPYAEDLDAGRPSALARWFGIHVPPPQGSSACRFLTAAKATTSTPPRDEARALDLLEQVVLPHMTQWQIVWNLSRRTLLLRQREAGLGTLNLRLDSLDLRCTAAPRARRLGGSADAAVAPWSQRDALMAEQAVLRQVRSTGEAARLLAARVAHATLSSKCLPAQ